MDFADLGLQLSRASRALKIWVSLQYFGLDAFRAAIDRSLDMAELARRRIEESDTLELAAPPSLGIVCLRRRFPDAADEDEQDCRNGALVDALEHSGLGLVSGTRMHGEFAIRLCVMNHTTDEDAVGRVLGFLESAEIEREARPRRAAPATATSPTRGWRPSSAATPSSRSFRSSTGSLPTSCAWCRTPAGPGRPWTAR